MVKFIESELILLKKEIDEMWTLVYNQLDRAGEAVLTLDKELAQQVMVRERRVNAFELKIDSDVEDIIALYNPVAIDLRFVLAMLKINTNLERLGDFAEGIARFVLRCKEPVLDAELLNRLRLAEMQAEVLSMLELAKRALNEESNDLAAGVFAKDNLLDEINADATGILSDYIIEHPEAVHTCVDLVSVFRKLERSGDHITNIAEEIVFFVVRKVRDKKYCGQRRYFGNAFVHRTTWRKRNERRKYRDRYSDKRKANRKRGFRLQRKRQYAEVFYPRSACDRREKLHVFRERKTACARDKGIRKTF